jgi:formylglycine-generating enzyme required for sulfatase activity
MIRKMMVALACLVLALGAAATLLFFKQNPVAYADVRHDVQPIEPEMVEIPAGTFMMGNPLGTDVEKPVHEVMLSAYSIGRYEVTNAEYRRFCEATGRPYPEDPEISQGKNYSAMLPRYPAVMMSWTDAAAYCLWLKNRTGKDYHLPTDAQWEKAARGGLAGKIYPWGDDKREGMAQMNSSWSVGPVAVGSFPPNGYGLFDMVGNVNEMTADWYDENYYKHSPRVDPTGPSGLGNYLTLISPTGRARGKGRCHVVRGGSYRAPFDWTTKNPDGRFETPVMVGAREYLYQAPYTHFDLGFRVALGGVYQ